MLLLCLLLMSQLSVLVEVSGQNTTAWTEMVVDTAKGGLLPGWSTIAWNVTVDSKKGDIMPGTQNDQGSEVSEDEEGSAGEGSADGGVEEGRNNKDSKDETSVTGTIIIVCSVIGLVALLILVGVVLSCRKPHIERGEYTLTPRTADDEHRVSTAAQPDPELIG